LNAEIHGEPMRVERLLRISVAYFEPSALLPGKAVFAELLGDVDGRHPWACSHAWSFVDWSFNGQISGCVQMPA